MNTALTDRLITLLAPEGYTPRQESEAKYPPRNLPEGALVMRVPPSPTGFVHIGTIYAGLINERLAHQTDGVFIVRIEDTDKKREVAGATDAIVRAFNDFGISFDEGPSKEAAYGPYLQSERAKTYLGYAVDLLQKGRAYPCFATAEELAAAVKEQQSQKLRPGYYGKWALWRDKSDEEIASALDAGTPFVLRFKSLGEHHKRIQFKDVFKGDMNVPENDLDVPLIKSDESRLPTYHLAHVVDDTLMRISMVFRSDEWLPSTALHIELSQALGLEPFTYGHFAPISILDPASGGKRKLSKRKDPQADVSFWVSAGYPPEGVKAYLLGLANSSFEEWYRANPGKPVADFPVSLEKLAASRAPLLDMVKLEDYTKDVIARMPQEEFKQHVLAAAQSKPEFLAALQTDPAYTDQVLAVERTGDQPRKDMAKFSDAFDQYGYFFDEVFTANFLPAIPGQLEQFSPEILNQVKQNFMETYQPQDNRDVWFEKLKVAAEKSGFAIDNKAFKANPSAFQGSVADFAKIIRVSLTGKNRTPDLWTIMQVMGEARVRARLNA